MIVRNVLLYLSEREGLQRALGRFRISQGMVRRFVAGETIEEALTVVRGLNQKGMSASLDLLGESVTKPEEAKRAAREYLTILDHINGLHVRSHVSLKLTQMGLDIDRDLALGNVTRIVSQAQKHGNFVRIDMEGSDYTAITLDIFEQLRRSFDNVGIVIQAYLYRSEEDVRQLIQRGVRIRLCKGAYKEPKTIAFPKKRDTDRNFLKLTKILLKSGIYHGIATHDEQLIRETVRFVKEEKINHNGFEFQMLYGIRKDLQDSLAKEGYNVRVYIGYGKYWYPFFMRRMAERPANLLFVLKNILR